MTQKLGSIAQTPAEDEFGIIRPVEVKLGIRESPDGQELLAILSAGNERNFKTYSYPFKPAYRQGDVNSDSLNNAFLDLAEQFHGQAFFPLQEDFSEQDITNLGGNITNLGGNFWPWFMGNYFDKDPARVHHYAA
jgi:hypothetical protein